MKKIAAVLSASLLGLTLLTACEDPHEGEHCVSYVTHTHISTINKKPHISTTHDCVRWEKDK